MRGVMMRQGGRATADPCVALQTEIQSGLLRLLCSRGMGVRVSRLPVANALEDAGRNLFVGSPSRVHWDVAPHHCQISGVLDREFGSPLPNAKNLVGTDHPEIEGVAREQSP